LRFTTFDQENLTYLDSLSGQPRVDDILHFALPVCAPYSALKDYKYRVKLTPGILKKGKGLLSRQILKLVGTMNLQLLRHRNEAAKSAIQVFHHHPECTRNEKDLFKVVPDQELFNSILAKVKVMAPNMEQAKKAGKGRR
jgi:hypothetical protein